MRYRQYVPAPDLRRYVHYYWLFEKEAIDYELSYDRLMPEPCPFLVFQLDGAYRCIEPDGRDRAFPGVIAAAASRTSALFVLDGHGLNVGVRFRAGGSLAVAAFSPGEVGGMALVDVPWTRRVTGRLDAVVSAGRLDDIAAVLDQALRERLDPAAAGVWADLEGHLVRRAGNSSLDELVSVYGRSARTFERACRRETGYAPSEYRALVRCDLARSALCALQSPDLSALAHAVGFCDLPHFCHTFKRWSGITPLGFHRFCEPFRRLLGGSEALRLHEERSREILD